MTYDDGYVTDRERKISRALAIAMHVGVVLLFVFGVAWQKRHSEPAAIVDLWSTLAPPKQEAVPPPKPVPAPKVEVKPEPKVEPKVAPPPKPEVKPQPKPDIALRDKLEKERKIKEQQELERKKDLELEKRKADEKKAQQVEARKADEKKAQQVEARKADEKLKLEKERLAQEQARLAQEKSEMTAKLAKEQASAQSRMFDEYMRQISNKIKRNIVEPPNLQGNPQVEFEVRLLPGGEVMEGSLRVRRSSGVPAYDQAVERAILKASPLPIPPDPAMFNTFRELNLRIKPRE